MHYINYNLFDVRYIVEYIFTNYNLFDVRYIVERGGKIDLHSNNNQASM